MRIRKHQVNDLFALINRTIRVTDELGTQPRFNVGLVDDGGLWMRPHNEAGVVAIRIIQLWGGIVDPPNLKVGDSVTMYLSVNQFQSHYPIPDDSDERSAGSDRRDIERARSAIEGEGAGGYQRFQELGTLPEASAWFASGRPIKDNPQA